MNNNQNVGNNQPINQTNTNKFNGQYQNQNIFLNICIILSNIFYFQIKLPSLNIN